MVFVRWLILLTAMGGTFCHVRYTTAQQPATAEPIFSGPQVGEKLPSCKVRGVVDDLAGKELDFVADAKGKPIVLIFVNEVSRPVLSFTRTLSGYTMTRVKDQLHTGVIWLDEDATTAENTVKRVKHALTADAPLGVSLDGREGPGSYGLNRKVALTILIAKENKITANFALVQPSLQADMPKVLKAISEVVGGPTATLAELPGMNEILGRDGAANPSAAANEQLRPYLRPLIQRTATPDDVKTAAEKIEEFIKSKPDVQRELGRIANTIISNGKLTDYGTPPAQEYLTKWSKAYPAAVEPKPDPK